MQGVKIIDNFLPKYIQDQLENITFDHGCKYTICRESAYIKNTTSYFDGPQLTNILIEEGQFTTGDLSHFFLLPFQIACLQENILFNLDRLYRVKVNIKFKQESKLDKFINPPHTDNKFPNSIIGVYYVNDSDGDTIIYEGNDENNLKILKSIEPKKGRMILMDGPIWHSASHPLKTKTRMVINYNLIL